MKLIVSTIVVVGIAIVLFSIIVPTFPVKEVIAEKKLSFKATKPTELLLIDLPEKYALDR